MVHQRRVPLRGSDLQRARHLARRYNEQLEIHMTSTDCLKPEKGKAALADGTSLIVSHLMRWTKVVRASLASRAWMSSEIANVVENPSIIQPPRGFEPLGHKMTTLVPHQADGLHIHYHRLFTLVFILPLALSVMLLAPHTAFAVTRNFGTDNGSGQCLGFVNAGTVSWNVPADWSDTNKVECIGSGGGGSAKQSGTVAGGGGGGGAYAERTNITSLSGSISTSVGAAGAGGG